MQASNFLFVGTYHKELAKMLVDAERYLADDSCCFLLKIRLALELWCHDFADLHGIQLSLETRLCEKLEILSAQKIFPEGLLLQLNQLRQDTNQAVHIKRDGLGRHITMQPLDRGQQIAVLKCLFDLVCYTARYQDDEFTAPLWQQYPKLNLRTVLNQAMAGDGDACVQVAQLQLTHKQSDDFVYWINRGLKLGSKAALELLTEVTFAKTYAEVDLAFLSTWLKQFNKAQPSLLLDELMGRVYERQQLLDKALQSYDKAANVGNHAAIKRLLDYWGSRCQQRLKDYLNIGVRFNEPHALLYSMGILVATISKESEQCVANSTNHKLLKGYLVKARGMGIPGLGYIEGMCHEQGILGFAEDKQKAAQLVLENYPKLPAYCLAAVNTFTVLLCAEQFAELIKVAPKALAQLDEQKNPQEVAQMEFDIALALLKLHQDKTPVAFPRTPKQLLQSAAKRGYAPAAQFLVSQSKQTFRRGNNTSQQASVVPNWAQKLVVKTKAVGRLAA